MAYFIDDTVDYVLVEAPVLQDGEHPASTPSCIRAADHIGSQVYKRIESNGIGDFNTSVAYLA